MANPVRVEPFAPLGATVNVAVTGANQVLALTALASNFIGSIRLANIGTQTVFIAFGVSGTVVTAANGAPLLANSVEMFQFEPGVTHVAAIAGGVGSTLYATSGSGA